MFYCTVGNGLKEKKKINNLEGQSRSELLSITLHLNFTSLLNISLYSYKHGLNGLHETLLKPGNLEESKAKRQNREDSFRVCTLSYQIVIEAVIQRHGGR